MPFPLKIVGDEKDPSHVVVEANDSILWSGLKGWVEGVTFRRPRISTDNKIQSLDVFRVESSCSIHMTNCTFKGGIGSQQILLNGHDTSQMSGAVSISGNGFVSLHDVSSHVCFQHTLKLHS